MYILNINLIYFHNSEDNKCPRTLFGDRNISKVKQYEIVLSFDDSLLIQFIQM